VRILHVAQRTQNPAHANEWVATSQDNGGIHVNSTIASHAAYLMAQGGKNAVSKLHVAAIGEPAVEKIWYRAVTRYLGPSSGFRDAADATVASAKDLFGDGAQADGVTKAWVAVGVLPQN
jgi:neutral peptidase B